MSLVKSSVSDRLWGGGYAEATHPLVQQMNASVSYDKHMARQDLFGSIAHATMLAEQRIITAAEATQIIEGLRGIWRDIAAEKFQWSEAREDVHMNIEAELRDRIGAAAGKLHTARSRNDQVALDERLWLRRELAEIGQHLANLVRLLAAQAHEFSGWPMCGYTHLQRAQPVTLGHHLLAHAEALTRDATRLLDALRRADLCPLGSGALAGTTLPINRERTAELLGFSGITRNSLDAVADRDHLVEAMSAAALGAVHLSRLAEEIILFATAEFGYLKLSDAFTTGSSLMPQKKNPDMAELIRGKSGRVIGNLVALLVALKGLPLAYNKDMQEDKEPLFDSLTTWKNCLIAMHDMLATATWNKKNLLQALDRGFLLATDLADLLVQQGVPFRQAHEQVAALVAELTARRLTFRKAGNALIAQTIGLETADVKQALDLRRALRRRDVPGAPQPQRVKREAKAMQKQGEQLGRRAELWLRPCQAELILDGLA